MGKFNTKEQVDQYYNKLIDDLADQYSTYNDWRGMVASVFTSGIQYKDPKTGEMKISGQHTISQKNGTLGGDDTHKLYVELFGETNELIKEISRSTSSSTYLMIWYCRANGISAAELTELGVHPDSEQSKATLQKMEALKQDFHDTITSNDPEKVSDFYVKAYDAFQEDYSTLLTINDTEKLKENFQLTAVWAGGTTLMVQSLENNDKLESTTVKQKQNLSLIDNKLKQKYGPDTGISTMAGQIETYHKIFCTLDSVSDKAKYQNLKKTLNQQELKNEMDHIRDNLLLGFRPIKSVSDAYLQAMNQGNPIPTTSYKLAKADGIAQNGLTNDLITNPATIKHVDANGFITTSELAYMTGDTSYHNVCDTSYSTEFTVGEIKGSAFNYLPDYESEITWIHIDELAECSQKLTTYSNEYDSDFMVEYQKKVEDNVPLTHTELFTYTSIENSAFTPSHRDIVREFFAPDGTVRLSSLNKNDRYLVENMTRIQYHMTAAEYAEGQLAERQVSSQYKLLADKLAHGHTNSYVSTEAHKQQMAEFDKAMKKVGSTANSSNEFKKLVEAYNAINSKEPNYPVGHETEYQQKLKAWAKAADTYIKAKAKDGKKERYTDRGQIRYQMAKRMLASANASLSGIEKTLSYSICKQEPQNLIKNDDVNRLIDTFMGRKNGHSEELLKNKTYTKDQLNVNEIAYPDNIPFTDHEIALIGLSALTQGSVLKGSHVDYPNLTEQQVGLAGFVHTTTDIFYAQREHAGVIMPKFQDARQMAHDNIIAYMNGDKEPLAKMIGNNMKAMLLNNRSAPLYSKQCHDISVTCQEMMGLLAKDPELTILSGLTPNEIQDIKGYELAAKLYEDSSRARAKLIKDMDNPKLTDAQKQDLLAEALTISNVSNQGSDLFDKNFRAVEDSPEFKNLSEQYVKQGQTQANIIEAQSKGISGPELESLQNEYNQISMEIQGTQKKQAILASDKGSSMIISNSGKNGNNYKAGKEVLKNTIKETQAFKDLYASGKWKDIIKSDERLMRSNSIHKEIEAKKVDMVKASLEKKAQKEGPKKVDQKEKQKEVKSNTKTASKKM